jgi:hypothetical protein
MDEETRERKREEIRRRIAASKAAAAAKDEGGAGADGEAGTEGAGVGAGKGSEDAQGGKDAPHRSVPLQSSAETSAVAAAGAQRKSAEDLKSESVQDFLCALIKAIKFANPSWGLKKVGLGDYLLWQHPKRTVFTIYSEISLKLLFD